MFIEGGLIPISDLNRTRSSDFWASTFWASTRSFGTFVTCIHDKQPWCDSFQFETLVLSKFDKLQLVETLVLSKFDKLQPVKTST